MSKYIGPPVVSLSTDTVDVTGDITTTDATPEVIIVNDTHEDTDGGREGKVTFKGQQSGGEETTLAQIQASHDGTSDDEKGDLIFKTNDGSDGASPTERLRIDSAGATTFKVASQGSAFAPNTSSTWNALEIFQDRGVTNSASGIAFRSQSGTAPAGIVSVAGNTTGGIESLAFMTSSGNSTGERMRITSDGKVGIGESDPQAPLEVNGIAMMDSARLTSNSGTTYWDIRRDSGTGHLVVKDDGLGDVLTIEQSAGDFMLHTTNTSLFSATSGNGLLFEPTGVLTVTRETTASTQPLFILNSSGVDCVNILFRKNGDTKGSIGQVNGTPYIANSSTGGIRFGTLSGQTVVAACDENGTLEDNAHDLGASGTRWDDIFATNGTIQTSDENEKQDIASLTSAEITAATAISKLFKTFKWKDKVAAKGDNARTHTGVVAQQVQTTMSDAGLDASKYAFWCSDTWWEKDVEVAAVEADEENGIEAKDAYTRTDIYYTKEEAPEGATERTRLGVRYPELLAFIGAATEQRLTSIESRLTALEGE